MGNSMKKEFQVIIEGRPGAGKSSALFQLKNREKLLTPTPGGEGFYVENLSHVGTRLNVWEMHSSESARERCFATAKALCFVVDCTEDAAGIERAKKELDKILTALASQTPRNCFTVLVLANKQDLKGALAPSKVERALGFFARNTWRWAVQSCSATSGVGLKEGMDWVASSVRAKNPSSTKFKRYANQQRSGGGRGGGRRTTMPFTMAGAPVS